MSLRRFLSHLMLVALLLAPFGRIALAEAKAMPQHRMAMMASHCAGQPAPAGDRHHRMAADCMIACAAMAPAPSSAFTPPPAAETMPGAMGLFTLAGIRPEADPPPPRFS